MPPERLQKILAAHGYGSRRKSEELIAAGRVYVNTIPAILGQKADPAVDRIEVDGKSIKQGGEFLYYLLYKPVGVVSTNIGRDTLRKSKLMSQRDSTLPLPKQAQTVRDILPEKLRGRIVSVGRLDKESEGLLLLTNDGSMAQRLMHPKYDHEKEYEVEVDRPITDTALMQAVNGVFIDGTPTKPARAERHSETRFTIAISEGRHRQIRRMMEKLGYRVRKLKRTRIATITDTTLRPGQIRQLSDVEVKSLQKVTAPRGKSMEGGIDE